jgi:hypothetical protein
MISALKSIVKRFITLFSLNGSCPSFHISGEMCNFSLYEIDETHILAFFSQLAITANIIPDYSEMDKAILPHLSDLKVLLAKTL